jgi:hypothetical protein
MYPEIETMKKYLLPTALGFVGMFVAHVLLFLLSAGLGLNYMPYVIAYPIVYVLLVFLLTRNNPDWWLSNAICILLIPFTYWYLLLWSDGEFSLAHAIRVGESSGMLLILPFTFVLVLMVSLFIFKRKQPVKNSR